MVGAPALGSTAEPVLELLAVLGFPRFDGEAVLLLNLVPVPLGDDVERAEGDDAEVGRQVVDVASLQPLLVLIVEPRATFRYDSSAKARLSKPTKGPVSRWKTAAHRCAAHLLDSSVDAANPRFLKVAIVNAASGFAHRAR